MACTISILSVVVLCGFVDFGLLHLIKTGDIVASSVVETIKTSVFMVAAACC